MIALISDNLDAIATLCRKYRIKRLDLFGSMESLLGDRALLLALNCWRLWVRHFVAPAIPSRMWYLVYPVCG